MQDRKGHPRRYRLCYSFLKTADFRNVGKSLANFLDSLGDQIDFKKAGRLATRLKTAIWDILYGAFTNPGSMGKTRKEYQ